MNPEAQPQPPIIGTLPPGAESAVHIDMSPMGLFLQADSVVKAVMILLLLASIWCWAVVLDKLVRIMALRRAAAAFERAARQGGRAEAGLPADLMAVAAREWQEQTDVPGVPGETRGERRARIDHAMRVLLGERLRAAEKGLPVLATTGSAGPFIGLFGTVWGIMNSFTGIAQSQDTSLAVVAPGIAEALFATAMGLVAAIPAVIAYNKLGTAFGNVAQRFGVAISHLSAELARRPARAEARAAE